jgi:hypothetical protein
LQFVTLQAKADWNVSPLWVTRKAAGGYASQDYTIYPTDGKVQLKMIQGGGVVNVKGNTLFLYPNPTDGIVTFAFSIIEGTKANLGVYDIAGKKCIDVVTNNFPAGKYGYTVDLGNLAAGNYIVVLNADNKQKLAASTLVKQ